MIAAATTTALRLSLGQYQHYGAYTITDCRYLSVLLPFHPSGCVCSDAGSGLLLSPGVQVRAAAICEQPCTRFFHVGYSFDFRTL